MMTNDKLQSLRALAEAATQPGPWTTYKNSDGTVNVLDANGMWVAEIGHAPLDATFIASASPDVVMELIDRIESLEQTAKRRLEDMAHLSTQATPLQSRVAELERERDEERAHHEKLSAEYHATAKRTCESLAGQVERLTAELAKMRPVFEAACAVRTVQCTCSSANDACDVMILEARLEAAIDSALSQPGGEK